MAVVGTAKERALLRTKDTDSKGVVTYSRTYLVKVNKPTDDANVAESAFGLPRYGFQYVTESSIDVSARVNGYKSRQVTPFYWEVEVNYSSSPNEGGGKDGGKNPLEEPPTIKWGATKMKYAVPGEVEWDVSYIHSEPEILDLVKATGVLNSAYEPFVPPAEIDRCIPTFTYTRNEPVFNHRYMLYYVDAVNKYRWWGWPKRTVKIDSIEGTLKTKVVDKVQIAYWQVQYVFQFNPLTWDLFLLNQGTYYYAGGTTSTNFPSHPSAFIKKGISVLGLLTSNGDKSSTIAHYKRFENIYRQINFGLLNIPLLG